ncbi:MAG: hypothetical protein GXP17_02165 [Gammaproteobacteria bacterium]|nr:hypothetical protein [Gammaproteobacteria bacterium]
MRLIFVFFLLLNAAYFYWQSEWFTAQKNSGILVPAALPPGVESLVLLRERGLGSAVANSKPAPETAPPPLVVATSPRQPPATPILAKTSSISEPSPMPPAPKELTLVEMACFTLGPFTKPANAGKAAKRIRALEAQLEQREESRRTPKGYWVYLPPLKNYTAARKKVKKIQEMGLGDLFIMGKGSRKNAISLGLFKQRDAAIGRLDQVKAKGLKAVMETQYRAKKQVWLDVGVSADRTSAIGSLAEIAEGYPRVNLSQRACE